MTLGLWDDAGDLTLEYWGQRWRVSGWKTVDGNGHLVDGRLGTTLETGDAGDLAAGRLGTMLETWQLED